MTANLTRQVHKTTKTTNANGDTVTESDPNEETVFTKEIIVPVGVSAKEGFAFPVVPENTGLHFLTLGGTDSEGRKFATESPDSMSTERINIRGSMTRSFHLIDFPLIRDLADTVEWAHCSKIRGQERVTPWRNLTEMSATRRMAKDSLSAQLPERVLSSSHCTSRVP